MKNIVIFLDGTQNTIKKYDKGECTIIRRMFNLICQSGGLGQVYAPKKISNIGVLTSEIQKNTIALGNQECVAIYIEGIQSKPNAAIGKGVTQRVEIAYSEIVKVYHPGDKIFIYGFSRGAASALCLTHYINDIGVTSEKKKLSLVKWMTMKTKYKHSFYDTLLDKNPELFSNQHRPYNSPVQNVTLIDTVFSSMECSPKKNYWLKNVIGIAKTVNHFLAQHEERGSFTPCDLTESELMPVNKFIMPQNDPIVAITKQLGVSCKVLVPSNLKCLKQTSLDGSHSDIGGLYSDSALGIPVFEHIEKEFEQAQIPFNRYDATQCKDKMIKVGIRQENGIGWRIVSNVGKQAKAFHPRSTVASFENASRRLNYRSNIPNAIRTVDPTGCGVSSEFGHFFYLSRDLVTKELVEKLDAQTLTNLNYFFDLSKTCGLVAPWDVYGEPPADSCLFYYNQVDVEMQSTEASMLKTLAGLTKCSPKSYNKQKSKFEQIMGTYNKSLLRYNDPTYNRFSQSHLYITNAEKLNVTSITQNRHILNNLKMLVLIQKTIKQTNPTHALKLEELLCSAFKISANELHALAS